MIDQQNVNLCQTASPHGMDITTTTHFAVLSNRESSSTRLSLLLPKSHGFLHRNRHLLLEHLQRFVRRQIQAVETEQDELVARNTLTGLTCIYAPGMCLWQIGNFSRFLNSKPARAIAALQILEPVHRDSRCSRCKLQQT